MAKYTNIPGRKLLVDAPRSSPPFSTPAHLIGFLPAQRAHPRGTEASRVIAPQVADLGGRTAAKQWPGTSTGNNGKSWEKPWDNHGKIEKSRENHGKIEESGGKSWQNLKIKGKSLEIPLTQAGSSPGTSSKIGNSPASWI